MMLHSGPVPADAAYAEWMGQLQRILVRVLKIDRTDVEHLSIYWSCHGKTTKANTY